MKGLLMESGGLTIPIGRSPLDRKYLTGFADGWQAGLEAAAALVQPTPHVEEERECCEVAAKIRELKALALTPWPERPVFPRRRGDMSLSRGAAVNLVLQEDPNGCGVACLAMVLGLSYPEMKEHAAPRCWSSGMTTWEIESALASMGLFWCTLHPRDHYAGRDRSPWPPAPFADVHLVAVSVPAGFHWVVQLRDGSVLDPARGPLPRLPGSNVFTYIGVVRP